jgi:hypothetical protein
VHPFQEIDKRVVCRMTSYCKIHMNENVLKTATVWRELPIKYNIKNWPIQTFHLNRKNIVFTHSHLIMNFIARNISSNISVVQKVISDSLNQSVNIIQMTTRTFDNEYQTLSPPTSPPPIVLDEDSSNPTIMWVFLVPVGITIVILFIAALIQHVRISFAHATARRAPVIPISPKQVQMTSQQIKNSRRK